MNIAQVENDKIGKHWIILNDNQLRNMTQHGAHVIENQINRLHISPDSQTNNKNGFIGNTTDWSKFFPNEENAKIPELIKKAKNWEDNLELTLTAITAFLQAGLETYTVHKLYKDKNSTEVEQIVTEPEII